MKIKTIMCVYLICALSHGAPTKVGNGDDGSDLEGFELVKDGPLISSKKKAIELLKQLNVRGVIGLGNLSSEVEKSKTYLTKKDISSDKLKELGAYHSGMEGLVYARTFPRPHAATRFFPASLSLSEKQLVSLHIHEALHRVLPKEINEDENIVTRFTLAITGPESSFDNINAVAQKSLPDYFFNRAPEKQEGRVFSRPKLSKSSKLNNPSTFSIAVQDMRRPENESTNDLSLAIDKIYLLSSHLYPFGGRLSALGLGLDFSFLDGETESRVGPLGISTRAVLWTYREFDFEAYGQVNLNTLSNEELKESIFGRDTFKLGISMKKVSSTFYMENALEITAPGDIDVKIGNVDYNYEFGSIVAARVKAGVQWRRFSLGGFGEFLLSDNFTASSLSGSFETGRNRVVSVGPEVNYRGDNFSVGIYGRMLVDSTTGADYDFLGDLLGQGSGQGNIGLRLSINL